MVELPFTPLIIIGAGRSGTNVLRDVLTSLPEFATWKCDEINPIWRHGNINHPDDELPPKAARPEVKKFIRKQFCKIWKQSGGPNFVVEKTCANALRVGFIDAVLPEAKYIHIVRNGGAVVPSAKKRWRGELELPGLPYFLAKIRYAPKADLPRYGASFIKNRLALRGREKRFSSWGPRFAGMDALAGGDLDEICARQWAACVTKADSDFANMPTGKVLEVRYEDFVTSPGTVLQQVLGFLGVSIEEDMAADAISIVRLGGKAAKPVPAALAEIIHPAMSVHGYGE